MPRGSLIGRGDRVGGVAIGLQGLEKLQVNLCDAPMGRVVRAARRAAQRAHQAETWLHERCLHPAVARSALLWPTKHTLGHTCGVGGDMVTWFIIVSAWNRATNTWAPVKKFKPAFSTDSLCVTGTEKYWVPKSYKAAHRILFKSHIEMWIRGFLWLYCHQNGKNSDLRGF